MMLHNNKKILVVDDDDDIIEFVSYNLKKEGFQVRSSTNGLSAIQIAKEYHPDLILLDIMMPELDGIETCEQIRAMPELSEILIAFLTARSEDFSQIAGFSVGADDYITKPIRPKVLISRIQALLKRIPVSATLEKLNGEKKTKYGDLVIDSERHIILKEDSEIEMPKKEFQLLLLLSSKPSRLFTREEIYKHLWSTEIVVSDRTIDVYIRKIREKIGHEHIKTIKGIGYKFVA